MDKLKENNYFNFNHNNLIVYNKLIKHVNNQLLKKYFLKMKY